MTFCIQYIQLYKCIDGHDAGNLFVSVCSHLTLAHPYHIFFSNNTSSVLDIWQKASSGFDI